MRLGKMRDRSFRTAASLLLTMGSLASCSGSSPKAAPERRHVSTVVTARALCNQTYGSESHFADTRLTTVKAVREQSRPFVPASVLEYALSHLDDGAPAAWCLYPQRTEMVRSPGVVGGPRFAPCVGEVATAGPLSGFEVSAWCGAVKPRHAGPPFPPSG